MTIAVALDNSVLGDVTDACIPKKKKGDKEVIDRLIELAQQGCIELGIALTGAALEMQVAGERTRNALGNKLGGIVHVWPVVVTREMESEIQKKKECLEKIMQDRDGIDSGIFLVSTLHARYFLTTDYRYRRQFEKQEHRIREECRITSQVLTPSEFLAEYNSGTVS